MTFFLAGCSLAFGCGSSDPAEPDARIDAPVDAAIDAAPDGPPACQPTVLLAGGTEVAAQGWLIVTQQPSTMTYGADYVQLTTSTAPNARTSGQLLLHRAMAVTAGQPFKLEVVMQVESVSTHNTLDSAAAILGGFTPSFGNQAERSQMIYLDSARVGWADETQSSAFAVTDGAYHTYLLSVSAAGAAELRIDGTVALTRAGYSVNGTIAVGDQTNDPNVDSVTRIRSVKLLCLE